MANYQTQVFNYPNQKKTLSQTKAIYYFDCYCLNAGQVIELEAKNAGLEDTIQVITHTNSTAKFQQACKILNITRDVLVQWLQTYGWDRRLNDTRASTHESEQRGYCETKYEERTKVKKNGDLGTYSQVEFFILPKGMQVLTKHFKDDKK